MDPHAKNKTKPKRACPVVPTSNDGLATCFSQPCPVPTPARKHRPAKNSLNPCFGSSAYHLRVAKETLEKETPLGAAVEQVGNISSESATSFPSPGSDIASPHMQWNPKKNDPINHSKPKEVQGRLPHQELQAYHGHENKTPT